MIKLIMKMEIVNSSLLLSHVFYSFIYLSEFQRYFKENPLIAEKNDRFLNYYSRNPTYILLIIVDDNNFFIKMNENPSKRDA